MLVNSPKHGGRTMAGKNEVEIPDFSGFSAEAFRFLKALKKNNNREWFLPKKEKYIELLHKPMVALVLELAEECRAFAPDISINPQRNILRIYRDTRFSKDKSPYKTFVAATLPFGSYDKTMDSPGLYFQITPGGSFAAGGLYGPNSLQLRKVRESLQQNPEAFLQIIEDRGFKKHFGELQGEKLKTNPRGVLPNHEMIEFLRMKQFYVEKSFADEDVMKKDLPKKMAKEFKQMMPLLRWLAKSQNIW